MFGLVLLAGCSETITPAEQGAEVAASPKFSKSIYNQFSCATCHAVRAGEGERRMPGAPLAGATARPSYWGGAVLDLFDAVSACYRQFMQGGRLDRESEEARTLYAYLVSLERDPKAITAAVPFTVVRTTAPPAPGDAARGHQSYDRACAGCHGPPRTARKQLGESAILPDDTEAAHPRSAGYTEETVRQVIVQKIRNGGYLGFTGFMPPFSREVLTDEEIADIITYLDPKPE